MDNIDGFIRGTTLTIEEFANGLNKTIGRAIGLDVCANAVDDHTTIAEPVVDAWELINEKILD